MEKCNVNCSQRLQYWSLGRASTRPALAVSTGFLRWWATCALLSFLLLGIFWGGAVAPWLLTLWFFVFFRLLLLRGAPAWDLTLLLALARFPRFALLWSLVWWAPARFSLCLFLRLRVAVSSFLFLLLGGATTWPALALSTRFLGWWAALAWILFTFLLFRCFHFFWFSFFPWTWVFLRFRYNRWLLGLLSFIEFRIPSTSLWPFIGRWPRFEGKLVHVPYIFNLLNRTL